MSQLWGDITLHHHVHNTPGREGSTVLVILNGLRLLRSYESSG
jgi:hypothetical protein